MFSSPFSAGIEMARRQEAEKQQQEELRKQSEANRVRWEQEMETALGLLRTDSTRQEEIFATIIKLVRSDKTLAYYADDEGDSPIRVAVRHDRHDIVEKLLPYYQHILIPHDVSMALATKWIKKQKHQPPPPKETPPPPPQKKQEEDGSTIQYLQTHIRYLEEQRDKDRLLYGDMLKAERERAREAQEHLKDANAKIDKACHKMRKTKDRVQELEEDLAGYKEVDGVLPANLTLAEARKLLVRSLHKNGVYRKQLSETNKKRKVSP